MLWFENLPAGPIGAGTKVELVNGVGRRWRPVGRTRGSLAEIATRARPTIQIHGPLKKAGIRTAPGRAQVGLQFRAPARPDTSPNYKSQQEWGMGQDLGSEVERMGTPQRTSTHTHTPTHPAWPVGPAFTNYKSQQAVDVGAGPREGGAPDRKRMSGECLAWWDPPAPGGGTPCLV